MRERQRKSPSPGLTDKGRTFPSDNETVSQSQNLTSQNRGGGRVGGGSWSRNAAHFFRSRAFLDADLPCGIAALTSSMGRSS